MPMTRPNDIKKRLVQHRQKREANDEKARLDSPPAADCTVQEKSLLSRLAEWLTKREEAENEGEPLEACAREQRSRPLWLKAILWILVFMLTTRSSIEELPFLFVLCSIALCIAMNFADRKKGEISAYSVFNDGQEKILGTFDAEQIDRQYRSGNSLYSYM